MKEKTFLPIRLFLLLLSGIATWPASAVGSGSSPTAAPVAAVATITVLESGPGYIVLELQAPDLAVEEVAHQDGPCHQLTAPGLVPLARTGEPLVVTRGALLALPATDGLRLEVLQADAQTLPSYALCAAPQSQVAPPLSPDTIAPSVRTDHAGVYPGPLAEIGFSGALRGQPVAQVQFYPLQVDRGSGQLRFYPRLRVRLAFDPAAPAARPARTAGGAFEPLLERTLLNAPAAIAALPVAPDSVASLSLSGGGSGWGAALAPASLKVFVEQDGVYQITPADLVAAGWDTSTLDPRTLGLSLQGVELPVWVEGEDDGSLDGGDYLLFYGQAVPVTQGYTLRNVYWLTAGGANGLRMGARDVSPTHGYAVPTGFPATVHLEQDTAPEGYWQNPPGGAAQDHWYWTAKLSAPATANLAFQMPPFDSSAVSVTLRARLAGQTDDLSHDPDHHTRLSLNGTPVHEAWWNGKVEFTHTVAFTPTLLVTGANTLTLRTVGDTGAVVDAIYGNWLEIDYQALYTAQNDEFVFGAPTEGDHRFRVDGFGSGDVEAFDITDPAAPVRLTGVQSQSGGGGYTAVLEDHAGADTRYLALTPAQRRSPAGVVADVASDLRNTANGADEIIIVYDGFYSDTLPLVAQRQFQGLRVELVRVTDVYDEFSGGVFTPQAIRDFLTYAYENWQPPAPTYVLLVGDANLDYLDRFGTGSRNYVPTYVFDARDLGQTANDTWFACVDGSDPLPDLLLGRLSARSRADVQAMVSKTVAYEADLAPGQWVTHTLFVADDDLTMFETAAEHWIGQLPASHAAQRVYASSYPPGNAQTDVISAINGGVSLVAYIGHGNQDRWGTWGDNQRLLDTAAVSQLNNADRLPFVATGTCLNGFFPNPLVDYSIAEELARKAGGGAVGVWAPTALGWPWEHDILFGEMLGEMFTADTPTLGSITTQAKLDAYGKGVSQELIETFTLFGDPALRVKTGPGHQVYLPLALRAFTGQ